MSFWNDDWNSENGNGHWRGNPFKEEDTQRHALIALQVFCFAIALMILAMVM